VVAIRFVLSAGILLSLLKLAPADDQKADGSDEVIRSLAEGYKDERSLEQIKKDNKLIWAAWKGDADTVRSTLKEGARINSRFLDPTAFLDEGWSGYTALMLASLAGRDEVVTILIASKPDFDLERHGKTSLYLAVIKDRESVVTLLVKAGAKGDPKKIRLTYDLLRAACRGFKINSGEGYPLYPGSIGDPRNAPEIAEVLKKGADVNSADPNGYTALMYAANLGRVDNVKALLANGADASLKSKDDDTALSLAERPGSSVARSGRKQVTEVLKSHLAQKSKDR
jgi:ankyrin repeat protein